MTTTNNRTAKSRKMMVDRKIHTFPTSWAIDDDFDVIVDDDPAEIVRRTLHGMNLSTRTVNGLVPVHAPR